MPRIVRCRIGLLIAVLVTSLPGCGSDPYGNFVTVTGTLSCNGKPAEGATVIFQPVDEPDKTGREKGKPGPASMGVVQADGTFTLTTWNYMGVQETAGALVGPHSVTVEPPRTTTPGLTVQQQNFSPDMRAEVEAELKALRVYEPLECGTKAVTPASVEITEDGENTFDLHLEGAAPKRPPVMRAPGGKAVPQEQGSQNPVRDR